MSIQQNIDYHAQSLADRALSAKDPQIIQSILGNLTKSIQDGAVKPYVGIPLVQSINEHLQSVSQQANMMAALQRAPQVAPEQSLGAQTLASAEPSQGITAAPSNLPTEMAAGGIVAFADNKNQPVSANMPSGPTDYSAPYGGNRYTDPNFDAILKGYQAALPGIIQKYKHGIDLSDTEKGAVQFLKKNNAIPLDLESFLTAEPVVPVGLNAITQVPAPAVVPPKAPAAPPKGTNDGIIIHDDKKAAAPAADTSQDTTSSGILSALDDYKKALTASQTDRQGLKDLILGNESERAKDSKTNMWLEALKGSFKLMGGTSPYALTNLGAAGESLASGIAGVLSKEKEDKDKRMAQLVTLGLKGSELDTELAKLGLTRAEYEAKLPVYKAQAYHYMHPTTSAGAPKGVPGNVADQIMERYSSYGQSYKTAKAAPFYGEDISIPRMNDKPLTWTQQDRLYLEDNPDSKAGRTALAKWKQIVEHKQNERLGKLYLLGGRNTAQSALTSD